MLVNAKGDASGLPKAYVDAVNGNILDWPQSTPKNIELMTRCSEY